MISKRTRFEVFKRDGYTCRYCGRKAPEVVLEIDHIVPRCEGGTDDPMNLAAACWDCNRGKSGKSLGQVMLGEDPVAKTEELAEKQRQIATYNEQVRAIEETHAANLQELVNHWCDLRFKDQVTRQDFLYLKWIGRVVPVEVIKHYMDIAASRRFTANLRYTAGCIKKWRAENDPSYVEPEYEDE